MIESKKILKNLTLNSLTKKRLASIILILLLFITDRISKSLIINNQDFSNKALYINDFLNLELVWNTGIGFGLFSLEPTLAYHLITLVIFIIIVSIMYLLFFHKINEFFLFSMIIGGGWGNLYDRFVYYAVPDFIDIHFIQYHWFTFNLADIFISLGIVGILMKDVIKK